jgi:hypothetical protein
MIGAGISSRINIEAQAVIDAHEQRIKDAGDKGFAVSQERVPQDRGTLQQSGFPTERRARDTWAFGYTAPYAAPVEFGTDPFWPPAAPLVEWARRIGKDPGFGYAVQHKIAQEGIDAQPYVRPGADVARDFLRSEGLERYL